jgi:hypothetical protein
MAKVITFSRTFPSYHPKAGDETFFVEKIIKSISPHDYKRGELISFFNYSAQHSDDNVALADYKICAAATPKHHTIRAGKRFKVGDMCSPRVWSDKPYRSKQISIAPDIKITKIYNFRMIPALWYDECEFTLTTGDGNELLLDIKAVTKIANNDGLTLEEFFYWFAGSNMACTNRKPFIGQIICWSNEISY